MGDLVQLAKRRPNPRTQQNIVLVSFSCNDPENGNFVGRFAHVEFSVGLGTDLRLEGPERLIRFESRRVKISRQSFIPIGKPRRWVGNWCWDQVLMHVSEARRLAQYLLSMGYSVNEWTHEGPFADIGKEASRG